MILIIGLGNPGKKYQKTRHNIGFQVINEFAKENDFPSFEFNKYCYADISKKDDIILAKPKTFMNLSGKAVKSLTNKYKVPLFNLWVIHDDIDLPLEKIRISKNRGAAGHKGVESIIHELKIKNFVRLRIGIINRELRIKNAEKFVLEKFTEREEKIVKEIIKKTCQAVEFTLRQGIEKAMNRFNK